MATQPKPKPRFAVTRQALEDIAREIPGARRRIWIAAPYIAPDIGRALAVHASVRAQAHGVELRLLTDLDADALLSGFLSWQALEAFDAAGFQQRSLASLHAKVVVIDDWAVVGSANLTDGGASGNLELGTSLRGRYVADVEQAFSAWWRAGIAFSACELHLEKRLRRIKVPPQVRSSQLSGLPRGTLRQRPGAALRQLRRSTEETELRASFVSKRSDLPSDKTLTLGNGRGRAWRLTRAIGLEPSAINTRRTQKLLRDILLRHPERDARAHAAYRLGALGSALDRQSARALYRAYRTDPSVPVREAAYRAMRALGQLEPWAQDDLVSPRARQRARDARLARGRSRRQR